MLHNPRDKLHLSHMVRQVEKDELLEGQVQICFRRLVEGIVVDRVDVSL